MSDETPEKRLHDSSDDNASVVVISVAEPPPNDAEESDASTTANDAQPHQPHTTTADATDDAVDNYSSIAKGLSTILSSVIRDFDSRAEETVNSQDQLTFAIDRLTRELDQLLEDAPLPFIMQHAVKISGVRKRVSSLNTLLKSIQRRLDNVDRMLSVGSLHGKAATETTRQP